MSAMRLLPHKISFNDMLKYQDCYPVLAIQNLHPARFLPPYPHPIFMLFIITLFYHIRQSIVCANFNFPK